MDSNDREIIIKKISILESFFIDALKDLGIKEEVIDVEKNIDGELGHITPVLLITFGTIDKFEISLYKKSSYDDYSFDFHIRVHNTDFNFYNVIEVFEEDITHMDNKLVKKQIKEAISSIFKEFYKRKSEEVLTNLNESEVRDMMNNRTFIEYTRRLIEDSLKRHKIKYEKRLDFSDTVLKHLKEDRNSKLFQFAITLAEGVEFLIQVSSFPPLKKTINTIRIKLWNSKSEETTSMEVYNGIDKNYYRLFDNIIVNKMVKYMLPFSTKHIMTMNEYLNYKDIMYNNSNFLDKEDQLIKLHLDQLKDYESKKTILEDIFENTEEEINNESVYKIIEDNVFMQQYISLLTKKREMLILERSIEAKEEALEVLRNELRDELIEDDGSFKEKQNEIRELNLKLNEFSNLDIMFNKWNSNISKIERDLRKGRPLSISMLDLAQ